MRKIFIILLSQFILVSVLTAQTISGVITNNKGNAANAATVTLHNTKDSSIVKFQVSNENGSFSFTGIEAGTYFITASSVGLVTGSSSTFVFSGEDLQIPHIILEQSSGDMEAVVVTARKPLIQVKGDRMIVNVEGTINATGNNVLELLRRSPGVTIDRDERISMNAKSGVQIFIDGRPTPLAGADLASYLKTVQSSEIESIELITNPSAKYEAAGNAGIINIRFKKNKSFGTNGSITAGYNQGFYGKYNSGISLNHRNAKLNVFGNYNFSGGTNRKIITMNRSMLDSSFNQHGSVLDNTKTHSIKLGSDYFLNQRNTIGFLANANFTDNPITVNSNTTISYLPASKVDRILVANNTYASGRKQMDFNLNYMYNSKNGKTLNLNADHGFFRITSDQQQPNFYYTHPDHVLIAKYEYQMIAPANIDIYSVKGDYEQPLLQGKLGVGAKVAYVESDNNFQWYNVFQNLKELDHERSNRFLYKENVSAAYINYDRQFKNLSLQAGLRAENTDMNGLSRGKKNVNGQQLDYDSTINQDYLNLFPGIALNYSENNDHQFSLSLSRRIDRPAYQELNPFEIKIDDYLIQKGNAYLRPQHTTGINLAHIFKQKLNTSLTYSYINDLSVWIVDTTETSKTLVTKTNLANQQLFGLNVSYPLQYKNYSMFTNLNTMYTTVRGDFGEGRSIRENGFGFNLHVQNSLKFAKIWTAELSGFYNSPSVGQGNLQAKSMWSIDAGVQTKFMADKASLKLSVSDVFNSLQFTGNSFFAGQTVAYDTRWETRQVKLSMVFRFGSNEVKAARQRKSGAEEEIKRVQ